MSSVQELEMLFEEGKLGDMLVREFGGQRGPTTMPLKDSEFMIEFQNKAKMPTVEAISEKVRALYEGLGYGVEARECSSGNHFVAIVHYNRDKPTWHAFIIVMTVGYSLVMGGNREYVRVTCNRF